MDMSPEFWYYPFQGKSNEVYRVALGELIDATDRETFRPDAMMGRDRHTKSGSIGFMDVVVRDQFVPREGARPMPNPHRSPYLRFQYASQDCEIVRALTIFDIGIEPQYRRQGYATLLKKRAEELAVEWGLEVVVSETINNPIIRGLNRKLGYTLYDRGMKAVKRLKSK